MTQLFENIIRQKCEYSIGQLEQIDRMNKDRNLVFFLNEIRDAIVEIMYTSDEWFANINISHDQSILLLKKTEKLTNIIQDYENSDDDE
jgi:hypothetical protein